MAETSPDTEMFQPNLVIDKCLTVWLKDERCGWESLWVRYVVERYGLPGEEYFG